VTKDAAIFLVLLFATDNRELQLTLRLVAKEKVDQQVVVLRLESVFDSYDLHYLWSVDVQLIEDHQNLYELLLGTGTLAPHHVSDLKSNEINRANERFLSVIRQFLRCYLWNGQQRVD
jgi:hypothetical protein